MEWNVMELQSLASSSETPSEALALGKSVPLSDFVLFQHHFKECPKGITHIQLVLLFSLFLNKVSGAQKL